MNAPQADKDCCDCDCKPGDCACPPQEEISRLVASVDLSVPNFMRAAMQTGLGWYERGYGSKSLKSEVVEAAREAVELGAWSPKTWVEASAYLSQYAHNLRDSSFHEARPKPAGVSFALHGAIDLVRAVEYVEEKCAQFEEFSRELTKGEEWHLEQLAEQHNEVWADEPEKVIRLGALREAWHRGGPVRVGALLHLVRTGRPFRGEEATDLDLVPAGNPAHELAKGADEALDTYTLSAPDQEAAALNGEAPIHVLRVGKIYDIDGGRLVLDITEEMARDIAATTQKLIETGKMPVPISLEHGIEAGARGNATADRRPYGLAKKVYYDDEKKGVYATKEWTALGLSLVASTQTREGSALRISPRIKLTPAYHPTTGKKLGNSYIDVISLTTLPRQSGMADVPLSREEPTQIEPESAVVETVETVPEETPDISLNKPEVTGDKGHPMADKEANPSEIFLGRGTNEASVILAALGLDDDCNAVDLALAVEAIKTELGETLVELNRYQDAEKATALAIREREAIELLDKHEVEAKAERELFLASLMSDDANTVDMARKAITERGVVDNATRSQATIDEAKKRGAIPADFNLEGDIVEHPEFVEAILSRIPDGTTVRVGEPSGSSTAGLGGDAVQMSKEAAGEELSRLARVHLSTGKADTLTTAHAQVKNEYPEIYNAAFSAGK